MKKKEENEEEFDPNAGVGYDVDSLGPLTDDVVRDGVPDG